MVRGAVVLPHGTGKAVRIAVFAEGAQADAARAAGRYAFMFMSRMVAWEAEQDSEADQ